MSSAGRAANSNGCVARPKGREIGLIGFAAQIQRSSLIGSCAMETAEPREPCESRGSCTDLGAPGGQFLRATRPPRQILCRNKMSASLTGRLGSSTFRLSTAAVWMSLTGSCFSSESAPRPLYGAFLVKRFKQGGASFFLRQFPCSI